MREAKDIFNQAKAAVRKRKSLEGTFTLLNRATSEGEIRAILDTLSGYKGATDGTLRKAARLAMKAFARIGRCKKAVTVDLAVPVFIIEALPSRQVPMSEASETFHGA
jgi:hypothetical protein